MGTLKYDGTTAQFEDRLLAHIQSIVIQKLRRQESFQITWSDGDEHGGGRTAIWVHPAAVLTFHFDSNSNPNLDRDWLEKLMVSASSAGGLFITDKDGQPAHPTEVVYL
jgi:hypothetical protein